MRTCTKPHLPAFFSIKPKTGVGYTHRTTQNQKKRFSKIWKTAWLLVIPARIELATYRLGVDPIRHREVASNA